MRYPTFCYYFSLKKNFFALTHRHVLQDIDAQKLAAFSHIAQPYTNPTSTLHLSCLSRHEINNSIQKCRVDVGLV